MYVHTFHIGRTSGDLMIEEALYTLTSGETTPTYYSISPTPSANILPKATKTFTDLGSEDMKYAVDKHIVSKKAISLQESLSLPDYRNIENECIGMSYDQPKVAWEEPQTVLFSNKQNSVKNNGRELRTRDKCDTSLPSAMSKERIKCIQSNGNTSRAPLKARSLQNVDNKKSLQEKACNKKMDPQH